MDDFSRLEQKLAKLRQRDRAPGEARALRGSPDRLLTALLTEIDETILPRRLSFTAEGGETLHFAVGNRRLQAMVAPAPGVEGAEAVTNVALKSADDEATGALKGVIEAVLDGRDALVVSSARLKDLSPPSDVGVPVDQLSKAWGLAASSGDGADPATGLAGFVERFGDKAIAWIRVEGEEVAAQGGADDAVSALSDGAAVFLDGYFGHRDEFGADGGPLGLVFSTKTGESVVFIDAGEAMVFMRAEAKAAYDVAVAWQQITGL